MRQGVDDFATVGAIDRRRRLHVDVSPASKRSKANLNRQDRRACSGDGAAVPGQAAQEFDHEG
jgi:hypothetical protein